MPFAVGSTTVSIDRSCIYTVQILCADIVYEYCVWILCEYIAILRANILYVKVDRWPDVLTANAFCGWNHQSIYR